uniref:Uncharacterized protein n=1 Tax=Anticarsia gemmatalis multiple nucleopolyhedrovirus TaxID=268591 RepID=A0A0S3IZ25_9ABAC|nr:hypothetical protein AGNV_049 [Anticarsia gemmatalis multiple nucleopolyhedrovirus]ALR70328.1 hypothetical protein AGNV_049 [Anticarsia gemmatalis multiple nucleopolyhedrovirus]ALR71271.1 hypothetical protein AGNV_049 [Anticarsia gemmatalis multiple nucleopolyhedrovirus]ALR71897.1 hypothetical protein AGNV_049 [Anticarsia gemmatalis multiple nucleopolyhedrovirus]
MATTNVDELLARFKLENDWNDDLISLNNFYMEMLHDDKSLLPKQKANIMQQLCLRVDSIPIENLQNCLMEYQRVCENCNALHAPSYKKYSDLFCRKCGNCLCSLDAAELSISESSSDSLLNGIHCAYCNYYKSAV